MDLKRPEQKEYAPYYETYIGKVEGNNIIKILEERKSNFLAFAESIPDDKWMYQYEEGKWTIKEAVLHVIDTERIFVYRALRAARNDQTPMAGFDQNDYVPNSNANQRTKESLMEEYRVQRNSTLVFLNTLTEEMASHICEASGYPVTARSLAYMIAGHGLHHQLIIQERYL